MQLIGMLDSPYVRRVAITLMRLGLSFEHRPISLFRHIDEFAAVNPLLKAPTLVADDGTVLVDSTLIIDYAVTLAPQARSLMPHAPKARLRATRLIGLSLVVCEKPAREAT
jgi:glutathione S-transferase